MFGDKGPRGRGRVALGPVYLEGEDCGTDRTGGGSRPPVVKSRTKSVPLRKLKVAAVQSLQDDGLTLRRR